MKELLFASVVKQKTVRFTFNISNEYYGTSICAQTFFIATDVANPSTYSLSIPVAGSGDYKETIVIDVPQTQFQTAMNTVIATIPTENTGLGLLFSRPSGMYEVSYRFINETREYVSWLGELVNGTQMALYACLAKEWGYFSAKEFLDKLLAAGEVIFDLELIQP